MARAGINTVRTYTVPSARVLDEAVRQGLRVMIGLPWSQHIAFLDDHRVVRQIRREIAAQVRLLGSHPATLLLALGNEIPHSIVRWHGRERVERFLRELYDEAKSASPHSLLTYVNYPPTEYLKLDFFDVSAFNVYLHREPELRAYLARLQQIAGQKPLLLAEAGADSLREGLDGQAQITAMHLRAAFAEGACGAVAFSWTDEWWRGGHSIEDWAFGLVDAERQPKPALGAITQAFNDAPFSGADRETWPKVSVVVCAYNAAGTIDDCLTSLERVNYPDVEIIVVNDGSSDETGAIARRHTAVKVIDVPNGGLAAARNVGLAGARGDVVAYTDADVRVDPDWLAYLVQPMVRSDVVGAGGPNVVPADDPWVAQCVARAPGGPTHVLLDDRIAEHVPGCNMAFRREALLAIGGFNPVYLRAGDDVDVCWRLQARGWKIGFAAAALVWHHHRATVKAYWRQQAGYGEGETWLEAHHPDKFVGGHAIWRGRIYSPLPFVRSMTDSRVNAGVWGTAAFPSVYWSEFRPLRSLPHSPEWLGTSLGLAGIGALTFAVFHVGAAALLLIAGLFGLAVTIGRCTVFGLRSGIEALPPIGRHSIRTSRALHRALIAWLHFLQPVARAWGRVRGMWSPPQVVESEHVARVPWKAPVPSLREAWSATQLLAGGAAHRGFWSESWQSRDSLLTNLVVWLRASRPSRHVEIDDGWRADRDISLAIGRWGWLDLRALIEEHGAGRCLLRVGTRVRPSLAGVVLALLLGLLSIAVTSAGTVLRWPFVSVACVLGVALIFARAVWNTTTAAAVVGHAIARVTAASGMQPMSAAADRRVHGTRAVRPATLAQALQGAVALALTASTIVTGAAIVRDVLAGRAAAAVRPSGATPGVPVVARFDTVGGIAVSPGGDLYVADTRNDVIRRIVPRAMVSAVAVGQRITIGGEQTLGTPMGFESPAGVAVALNGDLYVADSSNDRVCRIDRVTGKIVTVAGSGETGFDGDAKQATQAALHAPNAIAIARNGDLYIADTLNNRVRVVVQATGLIKTAVGDGVPFENGPVGDDGPAARAHLSRPTDVAIAPNGDLYIADMGHNRIRKVTAATGTITTVAGDGSYGSNGDGGLATRASLAGPAGLALVPNGRRITLYVADYYNGSVRVVDGDGRISTLGGARRFTAPSRLAYHPGGWLYVADASHNGVTAIVVVKPPRYELAVTERPVTPRKVT